MTETLRGRATRPIGPGEPWLRGQARIVNGHVAIDAAHAEEYDPLAEPDGDLLYDLAALRRPTDALLFVKKHGVLWSGATACRAPDFAGESWLQWERAALRLSEILSWYEAVWHARTGDFARLRAMRDPIESFFDRLGVLREWPVDYSTDDKLLTQAGMGLSIALSEGLSDVQTAIWPADYLGVGPAGVFVYCPVVKNLVDLAYYHLGQVVVSQAPMHRCPDCGRLFAVRDKRQKFCSPLCAGRSRQRRYAERRARQEMKSDG